MNDSSEAPHNPEAERALVGARLIASDQLPNGVRAMPSVDFFIDRHRMIWEACEDLDSTGTPVDILTVAHELERNGRLAEVGGHAYLTKLCAQSPPILHSHAHLEIVREAAQQRWVFDVANKVAKNGKDPIKLKEIFSEASARLATDSGNGYRPVTWAEQAAILPRITYLWTQRIPVGLVTLVVGAAERGKSALILTFARSVTTGSAWPDGSFPEKTGLVVWVDTENAEALNRERAEQWGVPGESILVPNLGDDLLAEVNILTSDGWNAFEAACREPRVQLAVLDSLGGAHVDENDGRIKILIRKLGALARDHQIAVIIVHHPRKLRIGEHDELTLERVRGHSGIVQFARVIWGVDRPDPMNPEHSRVRMIKNNLGKKAESFGFQIYDEGLAFGEPPAKPRTETQRDRAADLLRALLAEGPVQANAVYSEGEGAGISANTFRRAQKTLGIISRKRDGRWWWSLPGQERNPKPSENE